MFGRQPGAHCRCHGEIGIAAPRSTPETAQVSARNRIPEPHRVQVGFPLFVLAMLLIPAAASVGTLLVSWELMALTSLLLVLAEHRQRRDMIVDLRTHDGQDGVQVVRHRRSWTSSSHVRLTDTPRSNN